MARLKEGSLCGGYEIVTSKDLDGLSSGENYDITIDDGNTYSQSSNKLFFEITSQKKINIKRTDGKAFVKTSIDVDGLVEGGVDLKYNQNFVASYKNGDVVGICEKVANEVEVETIPKPSITYDNVNFSVASQDIYTYGMALSNDGTKMFTVGNDNDSIYQYALSTPFDLSTATYDNVKLLVSSQSTTPLGIAFSGDGYVMFVAFQSGGGGKVCQYNLSVPFELGTASYSGKYFYDSEGNFHDVKFDNTGYKMYVLNRDNYCVEQYSLASSYDLSSVVSDDVRLNVGNQDTNPWGIVFNKEGSKMYMVGDTNDSIYSYTLDTPFDVSTMRYDGFSMSVAGQDTNPRSIVFNDKEDKIYMSGYCYRAIYQYSFNKSYSGTVYVGVE